MIETGKCIAMEGVEIWDVEWVSPSFQLELSTQESLELERVWLATGSLIDATQEPLFSNMLQGYPVKVCHGLPVLDFNL